jgi:hypothetical protein
MLNQQQYNGIGIVAKHCDLSKLAVAENEAINFDLSELFCGYWADISLIIAEVEAYILNPLLPIPENYAKKLELLNGGFYTDCKGKQRAFQGVYNLIAYYSYARYIVLNGFSDTPNGLVQKTNEFSIPQDMKALNQFSEKYRNMGLITFKKIGYFLCSNSLIFDYNNCANNCSCGFEDCGKTKAKGFGFKSSNINK